MKQKLNSIKGRIVAISVCFTLVATLILVSFSLYQYRGYARKSLIQSAEFNLNMVAGFISQDLDALDLLRGYCGVDTKICSYLAASDVHSKDAVSALKSLEERTRNVRAYQYLMRLIIADGATRTRLLQTGSGTSKGLPLTVHTADRMNALDGGGRNVWYGFAPDPLQNQSTDQVLYSVGPIYAPYSNRVTGTSYLIVSSNIITDPLKNYQLSEGCHLYMTFEGKSYRLDGGIVPVQVQIDLSCTEEETLNSRTRVMHHRDEAGGSALVVSCPVGDTGMWLTQELSEVQFLANPVLFLRQALVLCLGAVLLGTLILLLLSRMISRPIIRIQERMNAIAGGDFTSDPSIEWNDELGNVGRGINNLARSVQELMNRRLADEKAKKDLEYQMLQSQVNPHFLYNTLNSIKWMAVIQNASGIAEMTTSLARLLKNVSKGQNALIPLQEELALLDDYFVIEKYRYGGAITLEKEIEPKTVAALVPRFTLQPLLENAIFHGIEPKGGAGTVRVTAVREKGILVLTMTDDGVGMDPDAISALLSHEQEGSSGLFHRIGLSNVHRRIQYEFGPAYGLTVESDRGAYTRIIMRLPFVIEKEVIK